MKKILFFLLLLSPLLSFAQDPDDTVDIPDENFKYALLHPNFFIGAEVIDTNNDGEIQYGEAEAVDTVAVGDAFVNSHIQDMTGIEAFTNLKVLWCYNNDITSLDLSQNIQLENIDCQENQISSLDVQQNTMLAQLNCSDNQLTLLNLSQNTLLEGLVCENNHLSILNLTQNNSLTYFRVGNNQLNSLDIRNNNNNIIDLFSAENNPSLSCIFVDDKAYSQSNPNWHKDSTSHYVETQEECESFGINDYAPKYLKIYPNPVQNKLYIHTGQQEMKSITVFDLYGKMLLSIKLNQNNLEIDCSKFSNGIYFLKITLPHHQTLTEKILKL